MSASVTPAVTSNLDQAVEQYLLSNNCQNQQLSQTSLSNPTTISLSTSHQSKAVPASFTDVSCMNFTADSPLTVFAQSTPISSAASAHLTVNDKNPARLTPNHNSISDKLPSSNRITSTNSSVSANIVPNFSQQTGRQPQNTFPSRPITDVSQVNQPWSSSGTTPISSTQKYGQEGLKEATAETSQIPNLHSPSLTSSGKERQMLINPLTGDLEPMPSESSSESETDERDTVPNSTSAVEFPLFSFPSPLNDRSNSMFSDDDDDDISSIVSRRADTTTTDQSDSEATVRSTNSDTSSVSRHRVRSTVSPSPTCNPSGEKIKLRLKLEKNEPVTPAYKVDVSFVSTSKKSDKGIASKGSPTNVSSPVGTPCVSNEEPRVPPLHISLRGRNAAVVVSSKKEKWKDEPFRSSELKKSGNSKLKTCTKDSSLKKVNSSEYQSGCKMSAKPFVNNTIDRDTISDLKLKNKCKGRNSCDSDDNLLSVEQGEVTSQYTPVYPTEAEVASILRSVPSDGHKMSLSVSNKIKKRDLKKKFPRERSLLTSYKMTDESPNHVFNKLDSGINKSSNTARTTKSKGASLFKSVVKTVAKDRSLVAARTANARSVTNGLSSNEPGSTTKTGGLLGVSSQRRLSGDSKDASFATGSSYF